MQLCTRCGNPARPLEDGGATHPLPNGHLLYPCYGLFGEVVVAWPGTHAVLARDEVAA